MNRLIGGQVTVSGTAAALTSGSLATGTTATLKAETLVVKAHATNAAPVYLGGEGVTAGTGYPLDPGEAFPITPEEFGAVKLIPRPNELYVVGTASDVVSWVGTRV